MVAPDRANREISQTCSRVEHTGKALYRASKVETAIFSSVTEPAGCHQTSPSPVLLYAWQ